MSIGLHCPIDLANRDNYRCRLGGRKFDAEGHERGERINGFYQCPKCDVWWPCVEEPDMWDEGPHGRWYASGWWGAAVCEECGLLMVDQPDGRTECYRL